MGKISLIKRWPPKHDIGDDGQPVQRYSANWEIKELPGLFLACGRWSGSEKAEWAFSCLGALLPKERQPQECQQAIALWPHLQDQRFPTRQQALHALKAALLIQESERQNSQS